MSLFQQTANIKFMCKLGKSAVETLQVLQTDYGDNVLKRQLCVTGAAALKVRKNRLKTNLAAGDLQIL
jgi:hypothetical protein